MKADEQRLEDLMKLCSAYMRIEDCLLLTNDVLVSDAVLDWQRSWLTMQNNHAQMALTHLKEAIHVLLGREIPASLWKQILDASAAIIMAPHCADHEKKC